MPEMRFQGDQGECASGEDRTRPGAGVHAVRDLRRQMAGYVYPQ